MQNFEKLGAFYLGKTFDLDKSEPTDELLLYDAKDLTTHAMCVGMTGSGKTGLCISLIEEAAIDGVPVLAIDPKGDLGNLMLNFPRLRSDDFAPWIDPEDAARKGVTIDERAQQVADLWKNGIGQWGQDGQRIQKLRDSVDMAIYTPGSKAGLQLSIIQSFSAPPPEVIDDTDAMAERVSSSVSGLLTLLNVDADPVRSREHILLSNILDRAWRDDRDLDIADLIREVQSPSFKKVGVLDLDSFFPQKDRFGLAMSLNGLLASPAFASWMEGEPLDIQRLLWTEEGKPRISILSIAHLSDSQRMFFVTTVLNELVAWMRGQAGTTSLRAILYMDEVFGYFPPVANPPSKLPMLTLLKQARAFGVGCVLATQNPVDLDYKGLSNTGTWFLGRLQSERDKLRVLEGLEGAAAATGASLDRSKLDKLLAGLKSRVFLLHNVHDDEPVLFHTRWVLSYLRGPLTRKQIETLMAPRKARMKPTPERTRKASKSEEEHAADASSRPVVESGVAERFLPLKSSLGTGDRLIYRPALFGHGSLHFVSVRDKLDLWEDFSTQVGCDEDLGPDPWQDAEPAEIDSRDLEKEPDDRGGFGDLPSGLSRAKKYTTWGRRLKDHLYQNERITIWKCKLLKEVSKPDESEGDFRARLRQAVREHRDMHVEKLRKRYGPKLTRIQERIRVAEQRVEREQAQMKQQGFQTAISIGTTLLGALFGRKKASVGNVGRAATAARGAGRVGREAGDVKRAKETVLTLQAQLKDLEAEFEDATAEIQDSISVDTIELDEKEVRPRKSDIDVDQVVLLWTPWGVGKDGIAEPLF